MRLHELLRELPVGRLPPADPEVTGLEHDSRRISPGDLFVALVGQRFDGRRFAAQALERGAVAVLGPGPPPAGFTAPWISAEAPRSFLGVLAGRLYRRPHRRLVLVGVTGTNGKSTVVSLVARVLAAAGRPAGRLGTLGYRFAGHSYLEGSAAGGRTTPEITDLCRTLDQMATDGATAAAMEVSSHALALERLQGIEFDVGLFTNLTRDHLDFHGDLESYFAAKRRLFAQLKAGGRAVVALADDYGRRLAAELAAKGSVALTCGEREGDVRVIESRLSPGGLWARLATPRGEMEVSSSLVGRYNLCNVLAAVAAGVALEIEPAAIAAGIAAQPPLPGRLEPVEAGQGFPVFVDYAHTPAALEAALGSLAELSQRRVVVVFGCGGDRDRGKRPQMGRIAGELADLAIATSDNPRSEDSAAILAAVEEGLVASGRSTYEIVPDRREAIRRAVAVAADRDDDRGWTVVIAGKGHEEVQILGQREIPFSDRQELFAALAAHGFTGAATTREAAHG